MVTIWMFSASGPLGVVEQFGKWSFARLNLTSIN